MIIFIIDLSADYLQNQLPNSLDKKIQKGKVQSDISESLLLSNQQTKVKDMKWKTFHWQSQMTNKTGKSVHLRSCYQQMLLSFQSTRIISLQVRKPINCLAAAH